MLETWIPRSGTLPLSIIVKCSPRLLDVVEPSLLACKERWGSIIIRTSDARLWDTLLTKDKTTPPQLKFMDFHVPMEFNGDRPSPNYVLASTLPAVEHISFWGHTLVFVERSFSTLKTLSLKLDRADVATLIPSLHQLEKLSVDLWHYEPVNEDLEESMRVTLPNLKQFKLELFHSEEYSNYEQNPFFSYLVMPNMTKLTVCIIGQSYCVSYVLDDVSKLVSVSGPPLQSWRIFESELIQEDEIPKLLDLLGHFPSLRTLELPEQMILVDTIDAMTGLLPSLEVLLLKNWVFRGAKI